jgi:hypothetical protein
LLFLFSSYLSWPSNPLASASFTARLISFNLTWLQAGTGLMLLSCSSLWFSLLTSSQEHRVNMHGSRLWERSEHSDHWESLGGQRRSEL